MSLIMAHSLPDDTTPIYTSTRVPPAELPDRGSAARGDTGLEAAGESVAVARILPTRSR